MAAPILLSDFRMKKPPKKESESLVNLKTLREFRGEMHSRASAHDRRFDQVDAKFDQIDARFDQVDARFEQMEAEFAKVNARIDETNSRIDEMSAKLDRHMEEMRVMYHKSMLIFEEQNLRNKQAYDMCVIAYEAVQDLRSQIKPESFKD